jgi:DNA polymerase-3 subunit alpha
MEKIWERLIQFANYGFNKAHSASYATIAYWTAYLKSHYPLEYMAALLEGDLEKFDRVILDLGECERLGIDVLPPDINKSGLYFKVEGDKSIRFGLGGIKNIGQDIVQSIVNEREINGSYKHLDDFVNRNFKNINKKAIEYLIMAGTMDSFGPRGALLQVLDDVYNKIKSTKKVEEMGQIDIFEMNNSMNGNDRKEDLIGETSLPTDAQVEIADILKWEKELLGLYFSSHPLDNLQEFFNQKNVVPLAEALEIKKNNDLLILGVMVTKVRKFTTKKGEVMVFLTIEDKTAKTEAVVFPRVYKEIKDTLAENKPMLIAGRLNVRDGQKSIIVQKAKYIDTNKHSSKFDGVTFRITPQHSEEEVAALKRYIQKSDGDTPVRIVVNDGNSNKDVVLKKKIAMNEETKEWLKKF